MAVKICLFVGLDRSLIDDLTLPAVPAVGTLLHVPSGEDELRLVVRRVEMVAMNATQQTSEPAVHVFCDEVRLAHLASTN